MSLALIASACTELQDEPDQDLPQASDEAAPVSDDALVAFSAAGPCFDWPLGGAQGGSFVPGWNTYVMQNYANRGGAGWYNNRAHAGVDLARNSGSTAGVAVRAAADGVVKCVVNANYPGWVTVIEHTMSNGTKKYTQYGHTTAPTVSVNNAVTKGQKIATVLDQGSNSHVHFEVRDWLYYKGNTGNCSGPGYAPGTDEPEAHGWTNPVDWHFNHRPAFPGEGVADVAVNVRNAPSVSTGAIVGTLAAGTRYPVSQVSADASGGKSWWYRIQYAAGAWGWSAGYANTGWGGEIYVVEPVRSCGAGACGSDCTQCVFGLRTDILPFYQANGWDTSCPNHNAILADWCSIDPVGCVSAKSSLHCEARCIAPASCGNACTVCVLQQRTDILPFYQANGWDTSCGNRNAIVDNWCSIDPNSCAAVKTGSACRSSCGL